MNLVPFSHLTLTKTKRLVAWVLFLTGLFMTAFVTHYVHEKNLKEDLLRFDYEKNFIIRRIENRLQSYESALLTTRAFLLNSDSVELSDLQSFIRDTEIFTRVPGLQGLGYTKFIEADDLQRHIKKMSSIFPGYNVFPEAKRDVYTAIVALEPTDWRNKRAIGFDMFSEPVRRAAMERARDENAATFSNRVVLVQEKEGLKLPGFLLYLPVYRPGADLSSVEGKRKNILGYVYSPFRAKQLFDAIFEQSNMVLDVEVFDGESEAPEELYFDFNKVSSAYAPLNMRTKEVIEINGKKFTLRFSPLDNFPKVSSVFKTAGVISGGLFLTFLILFLYLLTAKQLMAITLVAEERQKLFEREKEHVIARDEFLSIASHELKTPLTSLKLQAQVMMRAMKRNDPAALTPEKVSNLIRQIDHQTSRLTRLVDDMLDISRIKTGRLRIQKEEVEISEVITDVIERLSGQFMSTIGELPRFKEKEKIVAHVDRFRLEQVLNNLFTNALRYGGGKPVDVSLSRLDQEARISVTDFGMGIAPENVDRIFERFERAGMSSSEVSGLGLGLFITRQIIIAHGGNIEVQSGPGKGSTFIVSIPV